LVCALRFCLLRWFHEAVSSGPGGHGQRFEASEPDVLIDLWPAGSLQSWQPLNGAGHDSPRFDPSQDATHAPMKAETKRQMSVGFSAKVQPVWILKYRWVAVGRSLTKYYLGSRG
jgi:hypothetical protein